jgi:hypothetical protein
MYDWLVKEIAEVKEPKFHIGDGPADKRLRKAIEKTELAAPKTYKRFALELGNSRLYRVDGSIDDYYVEVLASMHETENSSGERWLWIGAYQGHKACFRPDLLRGSRESPVFEWYSGPSGSYPLEVAPGFHAWLKLRCGHARKKFLKGRWKAILAGPEPLTPEERVIVTARKKFRWKLLGIAKNGDLRFQIRNGSQAVIPYFSLCLNHRDGHTVGGLVFKVIDLGPGQTDVYEQDCYKSLYDPAEIVPADYPPPGPEDRDRYWELSKSAPRPRRSRRRK